MAVSRRTAANESKYSCASEEACTKKSAAPIPIRMVLSKPRSLSTMTLSTTISVKTGKSRERMLTATDNNTTCTNVRRTSRRRARAMRGSPLIRGLAQKRSCNRKERRNQTTFVRTRGGESAGVLERGRLRARTFHRHRRAPSSGCLPSERLKAREDLEDSETKLLAHGQRDRARWPRDTTPSGWCHRWRCDKADGCAPG